MQHGDQQMLQKLDGLLPPLCNITQDCYAITCRATRRKSAFLGTPVWQQGWFYSCKDDMCKHLAWHRKQCYPSITAALWFGSFSERLWCPGAIPQEPLPLPRPKWLFWAVCIKHCCHHILWVPCVPWLGFRDLNIVEGKVLMVESGMDACAADTRMSGGNCVGRRCWSAPATLQQQMPCRTINAH